MGYIKMSAFKKIARLYSNYRLVGHDAQGNNIQISFEDFWRQLDIEASGAGQPIFFEGNQLPTENNTGDPLVKGDWTFLPSGQTYTNINGGDPIEAPLERISFSIFNGTTWSLVDMGELPEILISEDFNDFEASKAGSAELASINNSYNKMLFSTNTEPTINAGVITFSTLYIFTFGSAYARITGGTLDISSYFTSNSTQDRFAICVKALNTLKRTGGTTVLTSADLFVVRYDEQLDLPNKETIVLFYFDRDTGVFQSPFIAPKPTVDQFNNRSHNLSGSASNDLFLNTYDKLFFSSMKDPSVFNHVISWSGIYIFNGATNYISISTGSLDLNSYITTPTADRFLIYIDAYECLRRSGGAATTITSLSMQVARFEDDLPYTKGKIILFEYDVSNKILRSPVEVPIKGADIGINMHKYQYSVRAPLNFNPAAHSISWTERMYIFNRSRGTTQTSYLRIDPGTLSFAAKVAELPNDIWFVAYINTGSFFQTGDSGVVALTAADIMIKGWTEDNRDIRQRECIVLFNYNALLGTIESPFLEQFAQTKALEPVVPTGGAEPWFNKHPNVPQKLSGFFEKYMYKSNDTAEQKTRIVSVGNSLLARHHHTSVLDITPSENPPTLITKNIMAYLFQKLKGIKPIYRRYDSGFITENAAFDLVETNSGWDDSGDIYGAVRNSAVENASITASISADHDYFNFIDRKHRILPSNNISVSIAGGNGVVVCRLEGSPTWVEANGFSFTQQQASANASLGVGNTQFQRRIEFKKVGTGIGTVQSVTIQNNVSGTNFYYWGFELIPNGKRYIQLINVARGGHSFEQLKSYVQTDVLDRNPDLVIVEIPLLNMVNESVDIETNVNSFVDFVWGDRSGNENPRSLKNASNDWQDFQALLIIPHHSRVHYATDSTFAIQPNGYTMESIYNAIKGEIFSRGDVPFIDISTAMMAAIDADPLYTGDYYTALRSSGVTGDGYMNDSLHQNDKGTLVWAKELCPIFWGG